MKRLLIALAMLLGGESAALACSCMAPTNDRAEMRRLAQDLARNAVALVDVDVRSAYDPRRRRGELVRVRRTLAGTAPREFRIARSGPPSSAACDLEHARGSRAMIIIYRAQGRFPGRERHYRDGGLCANVLLSNAGFRQMVVDAMRRRADVTPSARPAAASVPGCLGVRPGVRDLNRLS